jgi:hypothetical protein
LVVFEVGLQSVKEGSLGEVVLENVLPYLLEQILEELIISTPWTTSSTSTALLNHLGSPRTHPSLNSASPSSTS